MKVKNIRVTGRRKSMKNKYHFNDKVFPPTYAGLGLVLGSSFGFIFGLLFFKDYFPVFIGIGTAVGLVIGSSLDSRTKKGE